MAALPKVYRVDHAIEAPLLRAGGCFFAKESPYLVPVGH